MIGDNSKIEDGKIVVSALVGLTSGMNVMSAVEIGRAVRSSRVEAFICQGPLCFGKDLVNMREGSRLLAMGLYEGDEVRIVVNGDSPSSMQLARRLYAGITTSGMDANLYRLG